jgi:hypothetical protein
MRITIGDLFRQQPVILTSLSYTLNSTDATWEINIEDDPEMMQVPHKVEVSCGFTYIGNEIPQFGGRFYSLAKQYDDVGLAKKYSDNWLSNFKDNSDIPVIAPKTKEIFQGEQQLLEKDISSISQDEIDQYVTGDYGPQVNIGQS